MKPSLETVASFVRQFAGISERRVIGPETRLDGDLGITGLDGLALLEAVDKHLG